MIKFNYIGIILFLLGAVLFVIAFILESFISDYDNPSSFRSYVSGVFMVVGLSSIVIGSLLVVVSKIIW